MSEKRLVRMRSDRMFLGVASGIAHYLDIDPVIVRLLFVLLALGGGHGLLIYLILAIIMPEEGSVTATVNGFDEEEIVVKDAS
ncbi:MAG: PspC domain-containing protein [Chloroflexi bacterium]|nr:MAG: PspC domain-containing protein [Chloroflexota bacterium]